MVLQMSQKQILIKLMTAIPRFQWNTQRKAFGTNAQPRIARYGSSRGLGTSPTRKIPMWPGKLHRYFCLCIYKGPARQFVVIACCTVHSFQRYFDYWSNSVTRIEMPFATVRTVWLKTYLEGNTMPTITKPSGDRIIIISA